MTCPKCGAGARDGEAFCGSCGTALRKTELSTKPTTFKNQPYADPAPIEAAEGNPNSGRLLVLAALVVGLLAGMGVFVWRMRPGAVPQAPVQSRVEAPPARARISQTPPVESRPALRERPLETTKPAVTRPETSKKTASEKSVEKEARAEPAPVVQSPVPEVQHTGAAAPDEKRRKAVQETDSLTSPLSQVSPGTENNSAPPVEQPPAENAAPAVTAVKYNGPLSGVATWTGKLEKGQILTITGGTPSMGVLSGAGLPGVPVRIMVDQSNLGFATMPNSTNGYRTVAFKSHAKHDRITIHWDVVQ